MSDAPAPPRRRRFARSSRLLARKEFRRVFDHGRSCSDGWLIVYALPDTQRDAPRLGLVVSRRFGSAVARNRWRRRVREAFRTIAAELPGSHDLVVLPVRPGDVPDAETAKAALKALAHRAAERCRRKGPK